MDPSIASLPPGDSKLISHIVSHLKSQGLFDQFRRDCLADVDTKPAYQNLRHRVENYVGNFLQKQEWKPDLNKNQLRDNLRRHINESGMLATGVDHVVEQVVNPKVYRVFMPQIESVVLQLLGKAPPQEESANMEQKPEIKLEEPSPPYEVCGTILTSKPHSSSLNTSTVSSSSVETLAEAYSPIAPEIPSKMEAEFAHDDSSSQADSITCKEPCKNTVETQTEVSVFSEESKSPDENSGERKKSISINTEPKSISTDTEPDSTISKDKMKKEGVKERHDSESNDSTKSKDKKEKTKIDSSKKSPDISKGKGIDTVRKPVDKGKGSDKGKSEMDAKKVYGESKYKVHDGKLKSDSKHSTKPMSKEKTPTKTFSTEKVTKMHDSKSSDSSKQKIVTGDKHKLTSPHKSNEGSKHRSSEGGMKSHEHKLKSDELSKSASEKLKHSKSHHSSDKSCTGDNKKAKVDEKMKKGDSMKSDAKTKEHSVKGKSDLSHVKVSDEKRSRSDEKSKADGSKVSGHNQRSKSQENLPLPSTKDGSKNNSSKDKTMKEHVYEKLKQHVTPEKAKSHDAPSSSDRKRHSSETKKHTPGKAVDEKNRGDAKAKHSDSAVKEKHKEKDKDAKMAKRKDEVVVPKAKSLLEVSSKVKVEVTGKEKSASKQFDDASSKHAEANDDKSADEESKKSKPEKRKEKSDADVKHENVADEAKKPSKTSKKTDVKDKHSEKSEGKVSEAEPETSAVKHKPDHSKNKKDDDDRKSDGGWSDVTVSSVHTSDLSDYDDRIMLTDSGDEASPKKKKIGAAASAKSPEKLSSPEKPRRGRKRKKLLLDDPDFVELSEQAEKPAKPVQQSEDLEPRRELRRQRKINPKYSSDEFASIFSKGKDKLHLGDMDELDEEPSDKQKSLQTCRTSAQEDELPKPSSRGRRSATSTSSIDQSSHELDLPYSPRSDGSEMEGTSSKSTRGRPPSPKSDVSFDSSHTPHGPTTPDSMTGSEGRRRSSLTNDSSRPAPRGRRRGRRPDQRYNNNDLYKPRPVISSSSRRNRTATPPPGTEDEEEDETDRGAGDSQVKKDSPAERQRHEILVRHDYKVSATQEANAGDTPPVVKRPRGRPRKRPLSEAEEETPPPPPPKKVEPVLEVTATNRPRGRPKLVKIAHTPGQFNRRRK